MIKHVAKRQNYEGCTVSFKDARIVLVGAGYDGTSTYRSGSRFAPAAIRSETILAQEDYSPYFEHDLKNKHIHDLGDIELPFGNKEEILKRIQCVTQEIVNNGKIPLIIGGEHLITLPAVKSVLEKFPDLCIIQLDAHLDLMDVLFGESVSHGTTMRRIYDLMQQPRRIFQVGIRSGSREEYEFAGKHTIVFPYDTAEFINKLYLLEDKPVYLTIDLDVFDPSLIPGTGTPEAGGIFFQEFIRFLKKIKDLNIVGADVVELSPYIDPTNISTIVASKILREVLMIL